MIEEGSLFWRGPMGAIARMISSGILGSPLADERFPARVQNIEPDLNPMLQYRTTGLFDENGIMTCIFGEC
jgi:hypothetical protein